MPDSRTSQATGPSTGRHRLLLASSAATCHSTRPIKQHASPVFSMLASLKRELGELDRVTEWIRAVCYVYCESGFAQNAAVTNGFSDLIVELWADAGRHAR